MTWLTGWPVLLVVFIAAVISLAAWAASVVKPVRRALSRHAYRRAIRSRMLAYTGRKPEVDPEDLRKYNDAALLLMQDLAPGEWVRWADLVNTAASMAGVEDQDQ